MTFHPVDRWSAYGHCPATGKRGYMNRKAARKIARELRRLQGQTDLSAYLCDDCGLFHIGHLRGMPRYWHRNQRQAFS